MLGDASLRDAPRHEAEHGDSGPRAKARGRNDASQPPLDDADDFRRRQAEAFREINRALGFYRYCRKRPCRRAHICMADDAPACFGVFFRALPEETQAWFRYLAEAGREGHDPRTAVNIANDKLAQYAQVRARFEEAGVSPLGHSGASAGAQHAADEPGIQMQALNLPLDSGPAPDGAPRNDSSREWAESRNSGPQDRVTGTDLPPSGGQNPLIPPKIRTI